MYDQKFNYANEQKTHSTKSEKWRHTRNSVFERVIVTTHGRNENLDD